jgi:chromosome partitioning protein
MYCVVIRLGRTLRFVRRVAVVNQKGGVGKTATTVNLAACFGALGDRVLVVDVDPQAMASSWLLRAQGERELLDVLEGKRTTLADAVRPTPVEKVDIIPASLWLLGAEPLSAKQGARDRLAQAIGRLPARWDWILFDCPPSLGILSVSALLSAEHVWIPLIPDLGDLEGLKNLLMTVDRVKETQRHLEVSAIIACRVERTRHAQDVLDDLRRRFGPLVSKTEIRKSARMPEAKAHREPIISFAPESPAAEDYNSLAVELRRHHRIRA